MDPARLDEESLPQPDVPVRHDDYISWAPPAPRAKFQDRRWLHIGLLALTILSTTYIGGIHYASFQIGIGRQPALGFWSFMAHGLWYSGTVLSILGCHELGHYLACRYYNVDASLPYFLPLPPFIFISGTMGAFIRIREPIPTKRMLFDIGIAGPLAGFLILVPALVIGISLSHVIKLPETYEWFGEPLIFKIVQRLIWGPIEPGYSLNTHPMLLGAWFGTLATALNLLPIGQLDGGHISYAVFGRRSSTITLIGLGGLAMLSVFVSITWVLWTLILFAMMYFFGRHHPRVFDEHVPLDQARLVLAGVALAILILSFMPVPLSVVTGQ